MDSQKLITRFRTFFHRQRSILTEIPPEIILSVFECSSLLDQICLALSCKTLYTQYLFFLQGRSTQLSQLLPPQRRPVMHRNIVDLQNWPRIQLLHRLEDKRWKYCSGCWNLHRHSAWRQPSGLPLHSRSYFPSLRRPMCMPYAGKIDVCLCLTMTIPDKLHLMATLERTEERDPSTRQHYFDGLFYHPVFGGMRLGLAHNCTIISHPLADVSVSVTCYWNRYKNTLKIATSYLFRAKKPFTTHETQVHSSHMPMVPSDMPLKTPFMCPHKNCKKWLRTFLDEAGMTSFELHKNCQIYTWDQCKCYVAKKKFESYHDIFLRVELVS